MHTCQVTKGSNEKKMKRSKGNNKHTIQPQRSFSQTLSSGLQIRCVDGPQDDHQYKSHLQTDQDVLFCSIGDKKVQKRHQKELIMAMFPQEMIDINTVICSMATRVIDRKSTTTGRFSHIQIQTEVPVVCSAIFFDFEVLSDSYSSNSTPIGNPISSTTTNTTSTTIATAAVIGGNGNTSHSLPAFSTIKDENHVYIFVQDVHREKMPNTILETEIADRLYLIGRLSIKEIKSNFTITDLGHMSSTEFNQDPALLNGEGFYAVSCADISQIKTGVSIQNIVKHVAASENNEDTEMSEFTDYRSFYTALAANSKTNVKAETSEQQQHSIPSFISANYELEPMVAHSGIYLFDRSTIPKKDCAVALLIQYNIKDLVLKKVGTFVGHSKSYRELLGQCSPREQTLVDAITFHFLAKVCCHHSRRMAKWLTHMELASIEQTNLSTEKKSMARSNLKSIMNAMNDISPQTLSKDWERNEVLSTAVKDIIYYIESHAKLYMMDTCWCLECREIQ